MKQILIAVLLINSVLLFAQSPNKGEMRQMKSENLEAMKVAYFTNKMDLTRKESQNFWPIYNEYSAELKNLKGEKSMKGFESLSNEEAELKLNELISHKESLIELQKKYIEQFKSVLSAKKVLQLFELENRFKEEMLKNVQKRLEHRNKYEEFEKKNKN